MSETTAVLEMPQIVAAVPAIVPAAPAKPAAKQTAMVSWSRDGYDALRVTVETGRPNRSRRGRAFAAIKTVLAELEAGDADEHRAPAWETGIDFDRKGRGEAINCDIYGIDMIDGQPLGVVQVRQYRRSGYQARHGFGGSLRKNYFLVGRNEKTGLPFAHAIGAHAVHAAIARDDSPESPVTAARAWIWDVPAARLGQIIRHGDVALIPVSRLPGGVAAKPIADGPAGVRLIDSHVLQAEQMVEVGGRLYARDPYLQHLKGQHDDVRAIGWSRVQIGPRADPWHFARPTAD